MRAVPPPAWSPSLLAAAPCRGRLRGSGFHGGRAQADVAPERDCGFRRKPATHSEAKPASVPI